MSGSTAGPPIRPSADATALRTCRSASPSRAMSGSTAGPPIRPSADAAASRTSGSSSASRPMSTPTTASPVRSRRASSSRAAWAAPTRPSEAASARRSTRNPTTSVTEPRARICSAPCRISSGIPSASGCWRIRRAYSHSSGRSAHTRQAARHTWAGLPLRRASPNGPSRSAYTSNSEAVRDQYPSNSRSPRSPKRARWRPEPSGEYVQTCHSRRARSGSWSTPWITSRMPRGASSGTVPASRACSR